MSIKYFFTTAIFLVAASNVSAKEEKETPIDTF